MKKEAISFKQFSRHTPIRPRFHQVDLHRDFEAEQT